MNVLEIAANMVRNAVDTMSSKFSAFVKDEINAKVSTLYKPGGAATLATLPALTADNAGYVYDMSEAFTTSASFREGAGHKYPAGTNVVVSDVGDGVYKYDVLSGMLDGYVQESRKVGNVPLTGDIPVTLTGDSAITVTNTGTASAIGYSVTHNDSGVTAGSKGDTTNQTPAFGGTFKVLSATVDAKGHVTALGDHTVEIPDDPATAQTDGLMSKTDKAKLDALHNLISRMEIYCTAFGNPATFSDADAANVKDLLVTMTPTQSGSGDPSPDNVRPISGVSSVSVTRTGKNLWPFAATIAFTQASSRYNFNPPLPPGKYALTATVSNTAGETRTYLALFNETAGMTGKGVYLRNPASGSRVTADILTIDVPVRTVRLYASWGHSDASGKDVSYSDIQMELGDSATSYEPYQGQTVTVQLTDGSNPLTVYGGTLDVTTGKLVVTHQSFIVSGGLSRYAKYDTATHYGYITNALDSIKTYSTTQCMADSAFMGTSSTAALCVRITGGTSRGEFLLRKDLLADDTAANANAYLTANPIQVVAPLAAPLTYQLTPRQLATLSGYNSVSTDTGTVSVIYKADPVLSLGGGT